MQRVRQVLIGAAVIAVLSLSACAGQSAAAQTVARSTNAESRVYAVSGQVAPNTDKNGPGKGDKGNSGDKVNNGKKNDGAKNNKAKNNNGGRGNPAGPSTATQGKAGQTNWRGFGAWWRNFSARLFGGVAELEDGAWQLGRFRDAFPFAYPPGWVVRDRGDAAVASGTWQGKETVFQMTRAIRVQAESLQEWVTSDLQRLGLSGTPLRYAQAGNVRIAVVTGVKDPDYACPVAYVYLWTANPAGKNQRQALGVVSQAPGATCSSAELSAFVDAYLARATRGDEGSALQGPSPTAMPTIGAPVATPTLGQPTATGTPSESAGTWQRTRFFNAFSFAYPTGWTMDRLGDTAHLQGGYQGKEYVTDLVWIRDAPQVGLEQWARADLEDLGVNADGIRMDYVSQGTDEQIAVATGVRIQGYQCPVVRMYVLANNAASGGQRGYTVTVAQANGQTCDPQAVEELAFGMVQLA